MEEDDDDQVSLDLTSRIPNFISGLGLVAGGLGFTHWLPGTCVQEVFRRAH